MLEMVWHSHFVPTCGKCTLKIHLWPRNSKTHKTDTEKLERFQRGRYSLPDKCPNSVTLGLLGILPIQCIIQKNTLNTFWNILTNKDAEEYQIVERQLIMK